MQLHHWLLTTLGLNLAIGGGTIAFNVAMDPYGMYHSTKGRHLVMYGEERVAKYLLSQRYVPENFDAILVGSSMSANWNLAGIGGLRVYNESLNGGNVVEGRRLALAALSRPGISTAFLIVHPALTASHEFETVVLDDGLKRSALGSLGLWEAYRDMASARFNKTAKQKGDHTGTADFGEIPKEKNVVMKHLWRQEAEFDVDPIAHAAYRDLVAELREKGVQIVFIVPPTAEGLLASKRAAFDRYVQLIRSEVMKDADEWYDFTSDDFAAFRSEAGNFVDGIHLDPAAAARMVAALDERVRDSIARGRVRRGVAREPVAIEP